jgi:hypothetical protein
MAFIDGEFRGQTSLLPPCIDDYVAAASPERHLANRALFTRLAMGWARLLFPIVLAVARNP